jgi:hypothetical protein
MTGFQAAVRAIVPRRTKGGYMNTYTPRDEGKMSPTKYVTIWTGWDEKTTRRYEEIWVDGVMVLKIENVAVVDYRTRNTANASTGTQVSSGPVHNRPVDRT